MLIAKNNVKRQNLPPETRLCRGHREVNPMYQNIYDSLSRQHKALQLLEELLQEEYCVLQQRDTNAIANLEFSIQELIRQLASEKAAVVAELAGTKVLDYASMLPEEQGEALRAIFQKVDDAEQLTSRQASRNAQFSLALLDQSSRNLIALTSNVVPGRLETYSRYGEMNKRNRHPQAAILSGRL